MTFDLVRIGWPNTATIVALAIMPVFALTAATRRHPVAVPIPQTEAATICQTCAAVAAADFSPETVLE